MQSRRAGLTATSIISICCALTFSAALFKSGGARAAGTGSLSIASATYGAMQNLGVKLVTVNRTGGASGMASVTCQTINGTATAGQQFTAVAHTLTWADGDASPRNCHIPILNTTPFRGALDFFVELSSPSGAALGAITESTVTVYGDAPGSKVALTSAAYSVQQNAGSLIVAVARTGYSGAKASVGYATANGSAVAGKDYTAVSGQLTWNSGDSAPKTFVVPISNAVPFSGQETLAVALAGAKGTSIGTASSIVSIAGDGTVPAVPVGLAVTTGDPQVSLAWSPSSGATSYHVKRSTTSGGPYTQIGAPTSVSYTDTSVSNGTTYHYVVSALDSAGQSANSAQVSATPAAGTAGNSCGMQLGATPVIFCETFDAPAGIGNGSRAGELDGNVWGVSRVQGQGTNFGQSWYDMWNPTVIQMCDGTSPTVLPPNDIVICNGQLREASNDNTDGGFDDGDVTSLAMYPKQPFDFAGRTGTVSFDVSNDSQGGHSVWPEFWLTDLPVPDPFAFQSSWFSLPANALGVRFANVAPPGQQGECPNANNLSSFRWTVDAAIAVHNYVEEDLSSDGQEQYGTPSGMVVTDLDCVISSSGPGNMNHVELQVSQGRIDVYATDAGVAATSTTLRHIASITNANLSFTRGLVWLEDAHYNADKEVSLLAGQNPPVTATSQRQHTFSWDNLAFDGPFTARDFAYDAPDNTLAVVDGAVSVGQFSLGNQTSTWNVAGLPANPHPGAVRVLFNFNGGSGPLPTVLNVIVNGHAHPTPWPYPDQDTASTRTYAVTIPVTDLVTGTNVVQLGADQPEAFFNVSIVLGDVPGGVPVLPGSNNAYPGS